jgi:hypothetical protein
VFGGGTATQKPLVPTGTPDAHRAGRTRRGFMLFVQRIVLLSTGAPPARRTSPAAVMENLVNGDKTDMVNGRLPGSIAGRSIPCYRSRLEIANDSGPASHDRR